MNQNTHNTLSHHDHLDTISQRGGDHIREPLEKKLYAIEVDEQHQPLANQAMRIIAQCNMAVHAAEGNHSDHEAIWRLSKETLVEEIRICEEDRDPSDVQGMIVALATMEALDTQTGGEVARSGLQDVLRTSDSFRYRQYSEALEDAVSRGLCVNGASDDLLSVGQMMESERMASDQRDHNQLLNAAKRLNLLGAQAETASDHTTYLGNLRDIITTEEIPAILQRSGGDIEAIGQLASAMTLCSQNIAVDPLIIARGVPRDELAQLYHSSPEVRETFLHNEDPWLACKLLSKVYECSGPELRDFADTDEVVGALSERPAYKDTIAMSYEWIDAADPVYSEMMFSHWTIDYMTKEMDVPAELAHEFCRSAYASTLLGSSESAPGDGAYIRTNHTLMVQNILEAEKRIKHFTVDEMKLLREKAGIVRYDYQSTEQLQRLLNVVQGDPEEIAHIQEGDLTVLFLDTGSDHNGAFKHDAATFEKPSGRTLMFEIHDPTDFYRQSILLKKRRIHDSTRVVGAHGGTNGRMYFTNAYGETFTVGVGGMDPAERTPDAGWLEHIETGEVPGFARIAAEHMVASKGIDDPDDRLGRKTLIMLSCSQGGWRTQTGRDGSRAPHASAMAMNLGSDVDVISGVEPFGIKMDASAGAIEFVNVSTNDSSGQMVQYTQPASTWRNRAESVLKGHRGTLVPSRVDLDGFTLHTMSTQQMNHKDQEVVS